MSIVSRIKDKRLQKKIEAHKNEVRGRYSGEDITIISNNCLAGVIYNILGLKFSSPTINQWMKMAEYLEFISDLKFYMECELVEDKDETIKWKFPVGTLVSNDESHNNVNIYFNHYKSFDDAKQKWQERKKRILWDKIYVIYDFNDKDCDTNMLYRFEELPFEHKVSLTHYKKIPDLKYNYKINCISDNEEIIKEFQYNPKTGKKYFEEWDYLEFLSK